MASFHAKTSWKRPRKSEKQKLSFRSVPTRLGIENSKKIGKKKKSKNIMMASFQAKTSWERSRKSENKNYRFDQFLPDLLYRIPKK